MKRCCSAFNLYRTILTLGFSVFWTGNDFAQTHVVDREPIIFTQSPRAAGSEIRYPEDRHNQTLPIAGSRIAKISTGSFIEVLSPLFETAARPRVSSDASQILFVGRKESSQRFSVWQMNIDGSEAREVIGCDGDCIQVEWLSTLYTLDDAAPSRRIAYVCLLRDGTSPTIFTSRMDGTQSRQITFMPMGAIDPLALPDGRLFFRSPEPPSAQMSDSGNTNPANSFAVHIDGTELTAFRGDSVHGGLLSVGRPSAAYGGDLDAPGYSPSRLLDGREVVSRTLDQTKSKGLVAFDSASRRTEELYDTTEWDEIDPVVVVPRSEPAGHSSTVRESARAELYCLDVSIAGGTSVSRESLRHVRVVAAGTGTSGFSERSLGEAVIEDDGSFFVEVPAATPIRLELLDKNGDVYRRMENWTWVMPGERRGCIGCHEDPQLSPPNRHVLALRKPAQKLLLSEGALPLPAPAIRASERP